MGTVIVTSVKIQAVAKSPGLQGVMKTVCQDTEILRAKRDRQPPRIRLLLHTSISKE